MIIHKLLEKDRHKHYLCNEACSISSDKITEKDEEVTCLNCKKQIKKNNILKKDENILEIQKEPQDEWEDSEAEDE